MITERFIKDIIDNHNLYVNNIQSKNPMVADKAGKFRIKRNQIIKEFAQYCVFNDLDCSEIFKVIKTKETIIPNDKSKKPSEIFKQWVDNFSKERELDIMNNDYEKELEDVLFRENLGENNLPRFVKNAIRVIKKDPTSRGRLINQLAQQVKEYNQKLESKMLNPEVIGDALGEEELSRIFKDKYEKVQNSNEYDEMLFEQIKKEIKEVLGYK